MKNLVSRIKAYYSPARKMARRLRWLQRYAGKHNYIVESTVFRGQVAYWEQIAEDDDG